MKEQVKAYRKFAINQAKPIYKIFDEDFGQEFYEIYEVMKKYKGMDASKQTLYAEQECVQFLDDERWNSQLKKLDALTLPLLKNTGRMLGMIFNHFHDILDLSDYA